MTIKASLVILVVVAGVFGVRVGAAPASSVSAVELFVSPDGRDRWPGTKSRPFATLERAQRAVRARTAGMSSDIVVNLRGGTYALREPWRLSAQAGDSGEHGHRVYYQAYGYGTPAHERVVISGGRRVTGWRRAAEVDGAWRTNVGDLETRQLFVDGRRARRTALGRGLPGEAIRVRTGYATRNTAPQSWRHPEDIELVFNGGKGGLPYSEARCGVSRIRGDAEWSLIDLDQPCFRNLKKAYEAEVPGAAPGAPTDVENSLSLLRKPGSWYLDRSRRGRHVLYYLPRRREDPRRVPVVAPVLQRLLVGAGTAGAPLHDVTFRGLTFSHATWLAPSRPTGFPQIIGSWFRSGRKAFDRMPGHVAFRAAERIGIEGNRFSRLVHIHVNDFQVVSVNGRRRRYIEHQDNVALPPDSTTVIRMRPTDFTGKFVFHCHVTFHEDHGMMAAVQVVRKGADPPPPEGDHQHAAPLAAVHDRRPHLLLPGRDDGFALAPGLYCKLEPRRDPDRPVLARGASWRRREA